MIENRKFRRECVFMRKYRLTAMLLAGLTAASLMTGCGSSRQETAAGTEAAAEVESSSEEASEAGTEAQSSAADGENASQAAPAFSDVAEDYWAADAINGLAELGILESGGEFRPEDLVTRGEYAQMVAPAFDINTDLAAAGSGYSDVSQEDPLYEAINTAGPYIHSGETFEAEHTVSRETAVAAIMRAIGYVQRDVEVTFADAGDIDPDNQVYIGFAQEMGLAQADDAGNFNPKEDITRAEAASLVYTAATYKGDPARPSGNVAENENAAENPDASVVYMTTDISPEGLMRIYEALDWQPEGNVGVKMSTGEAGGEYYLHPDFIADLVHEVNGTIIECNTAYGGSRATTALHRQTIEDHGFNEIAEVDIMDEEGTMEIPAVPGSVHLEKDIVGSHLANYDSILVLSHFKGHAMGGFGGALKNISIGIASQNGKMYIHSGGTQDERFAPGDQNAFLESMAEAAGAVMQDKEGRMVYISVMNNLSVDCDCDSSPEEPDMHDIGILASYDPVALDRACVDLVYAAPDSAHLVQRIESRNGTLILDHAEELGLGSQTYELVSIDE